jgi:hypothetical protein
MFEGDDGPCNTASVSRVLYHPSELHLQSDQLLCDCLDPSLEQRQLGGHAINCSRASGNIVEVCLMEHERIVMKAKQMACISCLLQCQECIPIARSCRSIDPLEDSTSWKLALWKLARVTMLRNVRLTL